MNTQTTPRKTMAECLSESVAELFRQKSHQEGRELLHGAFEQEARKLFGIEDQDAAFAFKRKGDDYMYPSMQSAWQFYSAAAEGVKSVADQRMAEFEMVPKLSEGMVGLYGDKKSVLAFQAKIAEVESLHQELGIANKLLDERNRLMKEIPSCEAHGDCIPNAIEWVRRAKISLAGGAVGAKKQTNVDVIADQRHLSALNEKTLGLINEAIHEYHRALDHRKHGGVAQDVAFNKITQALGVTWIQGATLEKANGG
jgi:hypothetical protein